jgi:hypothetical protein
LVSGHDKKTAGHPLPAATADLPGIERLDPARRTFL